MKAHLVNLIPDHDNARTHSQRNLDAIAASLREFGQRKPLVVVDNGDKTYTVIAGNGTLEAARSLGWDEMEISPIPKGWTSDRIRAYALADNQTAILAEWDTSELNAQLEELVLSDFDIESIGFDLDSVESTEPKGGNRVSLDLTDDAIEVLQRCRSLTHLTGRAADVEVVMAAYATLREGE